MFPATATLSATISISPAGIGRAAELRSASRTRQSMTPGALSSSELFSSWPQSRDLAFLSCFRNSRKDRQSKRRFRLIDSLDGAIQCVGAEHKRESNHQPAEET